LIYAIRAIGTEFVKIGKANSVGKRLAEIQTHCPHDLELLAAPVWEDRMERVIHAHLRAHNERGEWFRLTPEVQQVIDWMLAGDHSRLIESRRAITVPKQKAEVAVAVRSRLEQRKAWWAAKERRESVASN
jgi:hypothetical protein